MACSPALLPQVAIAVMKVASQAVSAVPTVFLFPVVPFLVRLGLA